MNEAYVECLVKQKTPVIWKLLRGLLIALTVIFVLGGLVYAVIFIPALITGVGAYFLNLRTNLEYEYVYCDKEVTVDKIMAKTKRKRVAVYEVSKMEIFAPVKSYHLDNYKNRQVKTLDFSIGEELKPDKRYACYYEGGQKLLFSPSEEMVKAMRMVAPRKVFTD